jgi:2-amino-4-hydroxy-6-hydroxymethyldihydropteridine diphosphokinase
MILIGLGANLPSAAGGPLDTCLAALERLSGHGVAIQAIAPWYESAPIPLSDQPWFLNGVARITTTLGPDELLEVLQDIEAAYGRLRTEANAARTLDLDLLAYGDLVRKAPAPILPHPRLHERAFVLMPLRDLAPDWKHPILGRTAAALAAGLAPGQLIRPLSKGTFART